MEDRGKDKTWELLLDGIPMQWKLIEGEIALLVEVLGTWPAIVEIEI